MPQKKSPMNLWKTMDKKGIRRLAVAVFFLFGTIGPLTMLMDNSILPGSWFRLFYLTVLEGAFAACIILFIRKPFLLVVLLLLIVGAMISADRVEELLLGRSEQNMILTANHLFTLTQAELDRIDERRPAFGLLAVALLGTGYALFLMVINEENKKSTRLETEIAVARTIQKSLQPSEVFKTDWCEAAGATVPATEVSGDYFDMIKISDDEIVFVIADVSGHGVGAGILSAMTKSAIHTELHHNTTPAELMFNLNSAVYQVTDKKMFVSFAYLLLDRRTMTAHVATAGHPPIFLVRKSDGAIIEIRTPNLALAVQPSTQYTEQAVQFNRGDILILYTDGIIEATNDKAEQFGADRLKELISDTERASSEALSNSIIASVRTFTVNKEFADDATIVVVRILA
ncbi:MAG: PP2C family protein-serine/threonine phosphatase [Bacteroidota bacterium]